MSQSIGKDCCVLCSLCNKKLKTERNPLFFQESQQSCCLLHFKKKWNNHCVLALAFNNYGKLCFTLGKFDFLPRHLQARTFSSATSLASTLAGYKTTGLKNFYCLVPDKGGCAFKKCSEPQFESLKPAVVNQAFLTKQAASARKHLRACCEALHLKKVDSIKKFLMLYPVSKPPLHSLESFNRTQLDIWTPRYYITQQGSRTRKEIKHYRPAYEDAGKNRFLKSFSKIATRKRKRARDNAICSTEQALKVVHEEGYRHFENCFISQSIARAESSNTDLDSNKLYTQCQQAWKDKKKGVLSLDQPMRRSEQTQRAQALGTDRGKAALRFLETQATGAFHSRLLKCRREEAWKACRHIVNLTDKDSLDRFFTRPHRMDTLDFEPTCLHATAVGKCVEAKMQWGSQGKQFSYVMDSKTFFENHEYSLVFSRKKIAG